MGQVNFSKFYSTSSKSTRGENPATLPVHSTLDRLSPEFCEWFAGFVDAEGLFAVYLVDDRRPKSSFRITLHKDDHAALEFIQDQLGAGNILSYPDKADAVYFKVRAK